MSATSDIGVIGEHLLIIDLLRHHCTVYREVTDSKRADFIADIPGRGLQRLQVKTTSVEDKGFISIDRERRYKDYDGKWVKKSYTADEVDIIVLVELASNGVYYIPITEFAETQKTMVLRIEHPKNGQRKNTRLAENFKFESFLK